MEGSSRVTGMASASTSIHRNFVRRREMGLVERMAYTYPVSLQGLPWGAAQWDLGGYHIV
jgi:hypothetical protein